MKWKSIPRSLKARIAACLLGLLLIAQWLTVAFPVYAQEPGGWGTPVNFSQHPDLSSDFPVLMCDPYQNVHVFWIERNQDQALVFYRNNADERWSDPVDVVAAPSMSFLYGAIGANDLVHLLGITTSPRGQLVYAQAPLSRAGDARSWTIPVVLASEINNGNLYIDTSGTLHVIFGKSDTEALAHELYYMQSIDSGATWSDPMSIFSQTTPVQATITGNVTVDDNGRFHVAWGIRSYEYGVYSQLGYIRSVDQGLTWSVPLELAASTTAPGVDVVKVFSFGDDEVHLTWDQPERLHRWSLDGGETWSQPVAIISLGAAFGGFNQLAKDSAGTLHAITAVGDGVYHSVWNGDQWGPPSAIDQRYVDPHHQQLAICRGNQLHVVYDDRRGDNEVWYATKTVNTPHLAARPIPQAAPDRQPVTTDPVTATLTLPYDEIARSPQSSLFQDTQRPKPSPNALTVVIAGVAPAAFVLSLAVIIVRKRPRQ